jgi:hypothetical protein
MPEARRARFGPGLWPGPRRQVCRPGQCAAFRPGDCGILPATGAPRARVTARPCCWRARQRGGTAVTARGQSPGSRARQHTLGGKHLGLPDAGNDGLSGGDPMADENVGRRRTQPVRIIHMSIAPGDPRSLEDAPLVIRAEFDPGPDQEERSSNGGWSNFVIGCRFAAGPGHHQTDSPQSMSKHPLARWRRSQDGCSPP